MAKGDATGNQIGTILARVSSDFVNNYGGTNETGDGRIGRRAAFQLLRGLDQDQLDTLERSPAARGSFFSRAARSRTGQPSRSRQIRRGQR